MNQAEKKARQAYQKNKRLFDSGRDLSIKELCLMRRQQDAFYLAMYARADKRHFDNLKG